MGWFGKKLLMRLNESLCPNTPLHGPDRIFIMLFCADNREISIYLQHFCVKQFFEEGDRVRFELEG